MKVDLRAAAADPAKYARDHRIPATLTLFAALVAIQVVRRGTYPSERDFIAVAVAALVTVFVASFAGDLVFYVLLIGIVISMIENVDVLADLMGKGERRFREALAVAA